MKKTVVGIVIAVVVIILVVLFYLRANYVNGYIPDDYCARISNGGEIMNCTYVYENDGVLSYIQALVTTKSYGSSEWNTEIKKRGNFNNYLELYDIAKSNSSNGWVYSKELFSGETLKLSEFIRRKTLDAQIDVILNKEVSGDANFSFGGGITVADLNDNGKLDVIVSRGMGGQGFCNNDVAVYEVNDALSDLSEIKINCSDDGQELSDEEYENIAKSLYKVHKKGDIRLTWLEINEVYDSTIGKNVIYLNGKKMDEMNKDTIKELIRNMCRDI